MTGLDVAKTGRATARAARRAGDSKAMDRWARAGIAARGVVYGLIGVLAIQLAVGNQHRETDQKGAFQALAGQPGGKIMLWAVALGLFGYAIWQGTEAVWGHRQKSGRKRLAKRVESAAKALIYLVIGALAVKVVTGSSSRSGGDTVTAKALGQTGGRFLVIVVGLVIVGVGAALTWQGVRSDFVKQLNLAGLGHSARTAVVVLGRIGYVARGLVFALAGALVVTAAVTFEPAKARGLDAALRTLAGQPYGPWLLGAAAVGLLCFGVYCLADARLRRI
ncbi:MAG TPA: DUF1206 domain-containing protein [Mycobacteriales bacterium]|nr:DUF1206 domain-containing protein [Mycobacteriales bacterium]